MTAVSAAEFKRKFSDFLGRIVFKNEKFIITRRGRPVAQISSVGDMPRHIGQVQGWLEDSDPLFHILDSIAAERKKHAPRAWTDPK